MKPANSNISQNNSNLLSYARNSATVTQDWGGLINIEGASDKFIKSDAETAAPEGSETSCIEVDVVGAGTKLGVLCYDVVTEDYRGIKIENDVGQKVGGYALGVERTGQVGADGRYP
eukprot:TRINITY_DN17400_c0_g1_i1.p5 TRINITY_DN17400_c0_g1~~TRINITY_DN17400_c0_g1_i1.p5  ORF type:complete len:117 (+),score=19.97 TRINITY_DN17400_c0_g1_i1:687-1037(+)